MSTFLGQARARALRPVPSLPRPRLTIVPEGRRAGPAGAVRRCSWSRSCSADWSGCCCSTRRCSAVRTSRRPAAPVRRPDRRQQQRLEAGDRRPRRLPAGRRRRRRASAWSPTTARPSSPSPTGTVIGKPVAGVAGKKVDIGDAPTCRPSARTGKIAVAARRRAGDERDHRPGRGGQARAQDRDREREP